MAKVTSSLRSYLNQPNPKICSKHSWEGNNTRSNNGGWQTPDHIHKWEDFEHDAVTGFFYKDLEADIKDQNLPNFISRLPFHLKEIHDEDSLEALLVRWTNAVVSTALAVAQRRDASNDSDASTYSNEIFMARGGQGWIPHTNMTQKLFRPDWAGIQRNNIEEVTVNLQKRKSYRNILPGDSKLSSKWSIKLYEEYQAVAKYREPLHQIFTYCERARARYGYLITQDELVVVRLSYRDKIVDGENPGESSSTVISSRTRNSVKKREIDRKAKEILPSGARKRKAVESERILEYRCIDWDQRDPNVFTVNLALWCLHMMAKEHGPLLPKVGKDAVCGFPTAMSFEGETLESTSTGKDHARKKRKGANNSSFRSDVSMVDQ